MQAHGEVIDLRLASPGDCCLSVTRGYSIMPLVCVLEVGSIIKHTSSLVLYWPSQRLLFNKNHVPK